MKFTLSIAEKVGLLFVVAAILPYFLGNIFTIYTFNTSLKTIRFGVEIIIPSQSIIFEIRETAIKLSIWTRDSQAYFEKNNLGKFNETQSKIMQGKNLMNALVGQYQLELLRIGERSNELFLVDDPTIFEKEEEVFKQLKEAVALYEKRYFDIESSETIRLLDSISNHSREISGLLFSLARSRYEQFSDFSRLFHFIIFSLWTTVIIGNGLVMFYLYRRVISPISNLSRITFDISQGRAKAIPYRHDRNEIGQLYNSVRLMNDFLANSIKSLERANQLKSEFISIASHQLRTPLSAIKWIIELLMDNKNLNPQYKEKLQDIYISNQRLIVLVNDLLSAAKLEGGVITANKVPTNLAKLVENELQMQKHDAERKKIQFNFKKDGDIQDVRIDAMLIGQAIKNLIENAVAYAPAETSVDVVLNIQKGSYVISVHNEGAGIPEMEHDKLFTKFYRGPMAQRLRPEGSGLGLFIAKMATEANKGSIWFESPTHDTGGVTFYISIPINQ